MKYILLFFFCFIITCNAISQYLYKVSFQTTGGKNALPALQQALEKRLKLLGYTQVDFWSNNEFTIALENLSDTSDIRFIIESPGKICFAEVYSSQELLPVLQKANDSFLIPPQFQMEGKATPLFSKLITTIDPLFLDYIAEHTDLGHSSTRDTAAINYVLAQPIVRENSPTDVLYQWSYEKRAERHRLLGIKITNESQQFGNSMIDSAYTYKQVSQYYTNTMLMIVIRNEYRNSWKNYTEKLSGRYMVISVDGVIYNISRINSGNTTGAELLSSFSDGKRMQLLNSVLNAPFFHEKIIIRNIAFQIIH